VTLATGRRLSTARAQIAALGITLPVVLQTGAQIVDPTTGQLLYCNPVPRADAAAAVRLLVAQRLQPILYENTVRDQHLFIGPPEYDSPALRLYIAERPDLVRRLGYDDLVQVDAPLELAAIDALEALEPAAAQVTSVHCRTLLSYSPRLDAYFLEILHASCSKGDALQRVAQRLGIAMSEVIAVGDNYNDREMLQMAGLGVAMANAEPEILALADHVTASNDEDGIAHLVDQLLVASS
jgi:Cof subfamily protein (haloacid dehalogenase superfamily)